jgi:hypothetical protein
LTSEAAEKNASVDPQHRITIDDAKSKGLLGESSSSKKPPRPGIVITNQRQQRVGVSVGTNIENSKKRDTGKSGIGIKIIGGAHFSSIAGKKALNYQLLKIALSAMVIMGPIGQKGGFSLAIRVYLSMSRSEAEHQCMIG